MVTVIDDLLIQIDTKLQTRAFKELENNINTLKTKFSSFKNTGSLKDIGNDELIQLKKNIKTIQEPMEQLERNTMKAKQATLQMGLSMLFAGMAVQRLSFGIIKSSIKAFNKITTGGEEASGVIGVLGVHFELLKFAIGGALASLIEAWLPTIVKVILFVSDWITQHKTLTATLLIFAGILGTAGVVGGSILSFISGMSNAVLGVKALIDKLGGLKSTIGKLVGATLIVSVVLDMFTRDDVSNGVNIIMDALKAGFGAAFLGLGPGGIIIAIALTVGLNLGSMLSDLTVAEFSTNVLKLAWMGVQFVIEDALLSFTQFVRLLTSFAPGGQTPLEAFKENTKETLEFLKKSKDEFQSFISEDVDPLRAKNLFKEFKTGLSKEQVQLEFKGGDFVKSLSSEQLTKLDEILSLSGKTIETIVMELKGLSNPITETTQKIKQLGVQSGETFTTTQTFIQKTTKNNEQILQSTKKQITSTDKSTTALDRLTNMFTDITGTWLALNNKINAQLNKQFGVTGTDKVSGGIDFGTTVQSEFILRRMFGNKLAGVGQFIPGALSRADVRAGGQGGQSVIVNRNRPTVINNPTYIQSGGAADLTGF